MIAVELPFLAGYEVLDISNGFNGVRDGLFKVLLPYNVSNPQLAYLLVNLQNFCELGYCGLSSLPFLSIPVSFLLEHGGKLILGLLNVCHATIYECNRKLRSDSLQLTRLPGLDGHLNAVLVLLEAPKVLIKDRESHVIEHH